MTGPRDGATTPGVATPGVAPGRAGRLDDMVERTNGSPWFFIGGILLVVAGLGGPLLVDAATGDVQWLVRGAGVLVAIGGGVLIGFGLRRRRGR
ncbi:hypothetical protein [Leifsonia shinshuensis]